MEKQLLIAVCDDSETDRAEICAMVERILETEKITYKLSVYQSSQQLLDAVENGSCFHIMLLDVMLDEMDGLALAAKLRRRNNQAQIIFASVNRELALRGYEVAAARYLAKPLDEGKLREALLHCCRLQQGKQGVILATVQGQYKTTASDICCVEAYDRGTRFHLAKETVECRMKFKEAEALLEDLGFVTCHRSYLVNMAWIKFIRRYEAELLNGKTVPIGKSRYAEISKCFFTYAEG